jgi:MFS family permease
MPWGCVIVGLSFMGGYFISTIWHVYLLIGLFGGLGLALNGFATNTSIMPRWFVKQRGRATGIVLSGIGFGILALSPIIRHIIDTYGWRAAYFLLGLFILAVIAPASFILLRNRPEDMGQARDGAPYSPDENIAHKIETAENTSLENEADKSVMSVFRTLRGDFRFWAMMFLYFTIGFNNNTILSQLPLYLVDAKFSFAAAGIIFGLVGFLRTAGSVFGGWMGDAIGRGLATAIFAVVIVAGLILLLFLPSLGGGMGLAYLFVLIYGVGLGGMSACGSALNGDIFEGPTFAVIVGFVEICYGLGGVIGPPMAGLIFDLTGSYVIPFSLIIVVLMLSIFSSLWLHREIAMKKKPAAA